MCDNIFSIEHSPRPGFLTLHPKTEGAEVRHRSSSLAVHPEPGGPDAMVLGHQETDSSPVTHQSHVVKAFKMHSEAGRIIPPAIASSQATRWTILR
ncbi:beta-defensin 125 isoform X1 [Opisthocomus hoazin]|uniref:beta-defensin 125 isoform X1 n=1 Tax=Opisthocomus hoazin TaxID=30419 RepID=UPI003F53CFB0